MLAELMRLILYCLGGTMADNNHFVGRNASGSRSLGSTVIKWWLFKLFGTNCKVGGDGEWMSQSRRSDGILLNYLLRFAVYHIDPGSGRYGTLRSQNAFQVCRKRTVFTAVPLCAQTIRKCRRWLAESKDRRFVTMARIKQADVAFLDVDANRRKIIFRFDVRSSPEAVRSYENLIPAMAEVHNVSCNSCLLLVAWNLMTDDEIRNGFWPFFPRKADVFTQQPVQLGWCKVF